MSKEAWEISAANEFDERHTILISDCKVYTDQISRCITFEFLLDSGHYGELEKRSQGWSMCTLLGTSGEQVPGYDYIRGTGKRARDPYDQGLLDLCEALDIDYDDLMNDRVPMADIRGKEVACAIGEKEIVTVSSIYEDDPWKEEIRYFWGFLPVADMLAVSIPD